MELRKLNKDMLIELIIRTNDLNKMTDEELLERRRRIDFILKVRKDRQSLLKEIQHILEDEELQDLFSTLRSQADNDIAKLIDRDGKAIKFVWNSENPVDMVFLYNNKTFHPTDKYLCEFENGHRFLHLREKEKLYDMIIIHKGSGEAADPYRVVLVNKVLPSNLSYELNYQKYKDKEWRYTK